MAVDVCGCGLLFAPDVPEDVRLHRREHDEWLHGVRSRRRGWQRVGETGNGQEGYVLTDVGPRSPLAQRRVAEKVGRWGNRETRYDFGVYHAESRRIRDAEVHALLVWRDDRAVGILILDRRDQEAFFRWEELRPGQPLRLTPAVPKRWTVAFMWVHRDHRRKGVGSALLFAAARVAGVRVADLGWVVPFSDPGEAPARQHCPDGFWIGA